MENLGFANCREDLTAVSIALGKFELRWSKSAVLSNLRTTVKWPLYKEEIVDLIRRIERHKNTIQMAAMADNMYYSSCNTRNERFLTNRPVTLHCRNWRIQRRFQKPCVI
jgi:hypothetical protein